MNPLALLPLLAVAMAAPGGIHHTLPASTSLLASQPVVQTVQAVQPAVQVQTVQPALRTIQTVQPAVQTIQTVQQVQVPVTKTVHYENRPVVTGYQTTVLKPAIAEAPVVPGLNTLNFLQLPEFPIAPPNSTMSPIGDAPTLPPPTFPTTPAPEGQNGTGSDQGSNPLVPIPGSPIIVGTPPFLPTIPITLYNESSLFQFVVPQVQSVQVVQQATPVVQQVQQVVEAPKPVADAIVVEARSAPVVQQVQQVVQPAQVQVVQPQIQVAAVRAAQAGDFEPLVTKEKVLAPVRTHTQITPQVTQIQPEVTVRKVVQDVHVQTPVAVQTPVVQQLQFTQPQLVAGAQIVEGRAIVNGQQLVLNGQQLINGQQLVLNGQQILNGQQLVL